MAAGAAVLFARSSGSALIRPDSDTPPIVRAALGERVDRAINRSTQPLRFPNEDISSEIVEAPVVLEYSDSLHSFTLPPARFLRIDQAAGRIHAITVTPQVQFSDWSDTRLLVERIVGLLDRSGWARASESRASLKDASLFFADRSSAERLDWPSFAEWRGGGTEVHLNIKRFYRAGSERRPEIEEDQYLVELLMMNGDLMGRLYDDVYARRGATPGDPQTLDSWLRSTSSDDPKP